MSMAGLMGKVRDHTLVKKGWYDRNGRHNYMRSVWEYNYACYLDFLQEHNEIADWEYEPDTFWFEKIKRGVRSYLPDFKVYLNNGKIEYHEVKGYMDSKSKTKIKRMAKYYPDITLIIIGKKQYKEIAKWKRVIEGWKNEL